MSARVELLTMEQSEWLALGTDPAVLGRERQLLLGDQVGTLREVGAATAAFLARAGGEARWGSFLAVDPANRLVVGTCSYKGPPDADGAVEIAYFTFPVRAHTLPERNASVRVLEKLGFAHLGQIVDPEDGPVWRWERAPGSSPV
jgi:RimJ/RimL family protein N-acetyltransferase